MNKKTEKSKPALPSRAIVAGMLIIIILILAGCGKKTLEAVPELFEPVDAAVDTEQAIRAELFTTTLSEGQIIPECADISPAVDGVIDEVLCYPGKRVEKDELLFTLDQSGLVKKIESLEDSISQLETNGDYDDRIAEIDIAILQNDIDRLTANGAGASAIKAKQLDLERAELELAEAKELREAALSGLQAELEQLMNDCGNNEIRSPLTGNVWFPADIKTGCRVSAGAAIARVMDPESLILETDDFYNDTRLSGRRFYAKILDGEYDVELIPMSSEDTIAIMLSGGTPKSRFRITGQRNQGGDGGNTASMEKLGAGLYAVLIVESGIVEDAVQIPLEAVYTTGGSSYVYVQQDGGAKEKREITAGRSNGIMIEVVDGLSEGETIYVTN